MDKQIMDKQITFLYAAIADAQAIIKFIDTKATVIISILAAYLVSFFTSINQLINHLADYSCVFWIFLITFLFSLGICITITAKIIKPTNNPSLNVNWGNHPQPSLKFFLTPNDYSKGSFYPIRNSNKFFLKENLEFYYKKILSTTDEEIVSVLSVELFKVSYIRNIKDSRFTILLRFLILTTICFLISYFMFILETHAIIDHASFNHGQRC